MSNKPINTEYEKILIKGKHFIKGINISFINQECFGLKLGDKIRQIGQYISSSSYGVEIIPCTTYVGKIKIEEDLFAAFLLPPEGVVGLKPEEQHHSIYFLLYIDIQFMRYLNIDDRIPNAYPVYPVYVMSDGEIRIWDQLYSYTGTKKHVNMINKIIQKALQQTIEPV